MWKNYLKTAYRTLTRNKNYTLLNIAGLGIGIAVCLVIFMIISFETGYDGFHKHKDQIYRVLTIYPGNTNVTSGVPVPVPNALKIDFPNVKVAETSLYNSMPVSALKADGQAIKNLKTDLFFTEPSFFEMFDFKWVNGNPKTALANPNSVVLTQKTAALFFGDWRKALGKIINVNGDFKAKVTGILADVPQQTDFQLTMVLPSLILNHAKSKDWVSIDGSNQCYVMLPPGVKGDSFSLQLKDFSKKHRAADNKAINAVQPLASVHYDADNRYTGVRNFSGKQITGQRVQMLWLIASFILVIACVNFVNLATAQAVNRSKEIGVRKVMGSSRTQLKIQFLTETFLLVAAAIALALVLVICAADVIGNIINIPISLLNIPVFTLLSFLLIVAVSVTILAGLYPAMILSGFNPITALKNKVIQKAGKGISLRPVLVVTQFVIAQALIIACFIIVKQMNYFEQGAMGFEKDAILNIEFKPDSARNTKLDYLRNSLLNIKGIKNVSFANTSPAEQDSWWTPVNFDHGAKETPFAAVTKYTDVNYVDTYQLQIVAGRNIRSSGGPTEFMINEAMAHKLGFKNVADVLNKEINQWGGFAKGPVVGVIKDFHTTSFKDAIAPVFFVNKQRGYSRTGIAISTTNVPATIAAIEKVWTAAYPDENFEYQFLSDKIDAFYKEERQLSQLFQMFAGIAIFLSCLGLYGLASFMATQRVKEIGIRKVLGATVFNIVYLFSKDFVLLVILAFAIASPIALYFMNAWLQHYSYHISISIWMFLAAGAGSVIIALTTIGFKALNASLINPAKSLKSE